MTLSHAHATAIQRHVEGKVVHDLGAGNLTLSVTLLKLGAVRVIAVDKEPPRTRSMPNGLTYVQSLFRNYKEVSDVAVASWPINNPSGLHRLVEHSRVVIYLGKNTDATVCGYEEFWDHLIRREVLEYLPSRAQSLVIYGPRRVERVKLPEELAATDIERIWGYDELHGPAQLRTISLVPPPKGNAGLNRTCIEGTQTAYQGSSAAAEQKVLPTEAPEHQA